MFDEGTALRSEEAVRTGTIVARETVEAEMCKGVEVAPLPNEACYVAASSDTSQLLSVRTKGVCMKIASSKQRSYEIDSAGFLFDSRTWDEEFVRIMAPRLGIREGLTDEHWRVIKYIRSYFESQGLRPTIWETCRTNGLDPGRLYTLFPAGYLRGACKLAGLGYWNGYVKSSWLKKLSRNADAEPHDKVYRTDARGFLVDPTEWDRNFAVHRAQDLDMPHGVTDSHWKVIDFLRSRFRETLVVPTLQETCDTLQLDLDEIEELFPDGYHRGAVKLAGLRAH